mgnify:FL=1
MQLMSYIQSNFPLGVKSVHSSYSSPLVSAELLFSSIDSNLNGMEYREVFGFPSEYASLNRARVYNPAVSMEVHKKSPEI